MNNTINTIHGIYLGTISYSDCLEIQQSAQQDLISGEDTFAGKIFFLEHKPVITVGKFGSERNLLAGRQVLQQKGIELFETSRGGDFTYHGPGQLVCYPVLNLKKLGHGVKKYINLLEEVIIQTLNEYGIEAYRKEKYPGVWVGGSKIAFVGIYVRKHVTMHGFSLNITKQTDAFSHIIPCGIPDLHITSISEVLNKKLEQDDIIQRIAVSFEKIFGFNIQMS